MSAHEAVEGLKRLGLSSYEAGVFVALQRLGTGTASDVSRTSEVPRSQVYGAAESLAERGLIEVVESSPKRYRPVGLDAARRQLRERIDREEARAFDSLATLQGERVETDDEGVATVRGSHALDERIAELVGSAEERVMLVAWAADHVSPPIEEALRERADAGLTVMVVTEAAELDRRLSDGGVRVVVAPSKPAGGVSGRTLLVDDATVLLSVQTDAEGESDGPETPDETGLWTAHSDIGHILAQFIHAGMMYGVESEGGWAGEDTTLDF
ncbi:TrmB family transcriptional regulator [Halomarina salina]|uniref:TrmB family transcriptional regulator n=1 Tax=Halomarina salina TaxID=1872699 RepID=A0ABD5RNT1_9EURY|nr:helix-turn-helix domain-containing protein [Halomarina salina]